MAYANAIFHDSLLERIGHGTRAEVILGVKRTAGFAIYRGDYPEKGDVTVELGSGSPTTFVEIQLKIDRENLPCEVDGSDPWFKTEGGLYVRERLLFDSEKDNAVRVTEETLPTERDLYKHARQIGRSFWMGLSQEAFWERPGRVPTAGGRLSLYGAARRMGYDGSSIVGILSEPAPMAAWVQNIE